MYLTHAENRLIQEFAGIFSPETVSACLGDSTLQLNHRDRIDTYVAVLAERFARQRLRAAGQAQGSIPKTAPEVLFIGVHNAGRSQMAAALLDHHAEGRVHVRSAGSAPALDIDPVVLAAIEELGIDLCEEYPKPLTMDVVEAADIVVTMGGAADRLILTGKRSFGWRSIDPAGRPREEVRRVRDGIDGRVRELLAASVMQPA